MLLGRDGRPFPPAGVQSEGATASGGMSSIYPSIGCHHASYEVDSLSVMSRVIMPIAMVCPCFNIVSLRSKPCSKINGKEV